MNVRWCVVISTIMLPTLAQAVAFFPNHSDYYYQLGGTTSLYIPPVNHDITLAIGGNVKGGLNFSCQGFNPVVTLTSTLNDLKNSAINIPGKVINNLTIAVAAYPLYKLQETKPALYNLFQNAAVGGYNEYTLRMQDCAAVQQRLARGQAPFDSLMSLSDSQGWLKAAERAKTEDVDIKEVAKTIAQEREEYGLPWLGGTEASGMHQRPIRVIADVIIAGYQIVLGAKTSPNPNLPAEKNALTTYFPTPDAAARWAVKVLGDWQLSKNPAQKKAQAGLGLAALVLQEKTGNTSSMHMANRLWELVDSEKLPTEKALREVSAANLFITEDIIAALKQLPAEDQALTIAKLAEEIALQNMLAKALILKDLLQAGSHAPEVQNLQTIRQLVEEAKTRLNRDIETLALMSRAAKKPVITTLTRLLNQQHVKDSESTPNNLRTHSLKHGAHYLPRVKPAE